MASLIPKSGRWIVQWSFGGKRPVIHIGKMSRSDAREVASHIGNLVQAKKTATTISAKISAWLLTLSPEFHDKLSNLSLVEPRISQSVHLAVYFDNYIKGRTDLKPFTITNLKQAKRLMVKHFGEARLLSTISKAEAMDWQRSMIAAKLSEASIAGHTKKARQIFQDAVDRRLIAENPFSKIKSGSQVNASRQHYVSPAEIESVIAACPDAEWRLLFAMARFGGVRVPSEIHSLQWDGIDFAGKKIVVESPKTARHKGGERRTIPMFPELVEPLQDVQEVSGSQGGFVFHRLRHTGNLGTTAAKIVRRAGLPLWPKMFNNLRASRQTDLATTFPLHVVCAWIGNKEAIAIRHYLQVKQSDFDAAITSSKSIANLIADNAGQCQTFTEPKCENAGNNADSQHSDAPGGNTTHPINTLKKLQSVHKELQKELHRAEARISAFDSSSLNALSQHIAAARGMA